MMIAVTAGAFIVRPACRSGVLRIHIRAADRISFC